MSQLKKIRQVTAVGAVMNLVLAFVKIGAGQFAGSMALVADGIHSFTDLATDAAIWVGARFWTAPPDKKHPYGHGRYETMVNLLIAGVLGFVGSGIGWKAIFSIISGEPRVQPHWYIFYVALISIVGKELLYRWTLKKSREIRSAALESNAWHHRSDAFSSLPVAIGVIGSFAFPNIKYLDQIASILVTIMLLRATWRLAVPSVYEIMEASANPEIVAVIQRLADSIADVVNVHSIRCHRVGATIIIDMHMFVSPEMSVLSSHMLTQKLQNMIAEEISDHTDTLIHVEPAE